VAVTGRLEPCRNPNQWSAHPSERFREGRPIPSGPIQNYSTALIRSIPHGFGADETSARPAVETAKRWLGGVLGGWKLRHPGCGRSRSVFGEPASPPDLRSGFRRAHFQPIPESGEEVADLALALVKA